MIRKSPTYYAGIDLCKLIASLLVVILHCLGNTLGNAGVFFVRNVSSMAVPFFFVTSGFFYARGLEKAEDCDSYHRAYVVRLIGLYIIWGVGFLLLKMPGYVDKYGSNIVYLFSFIVRKIVFVGMGVYWYYLALAESVLIIHWFSKKDKEWLMYLLAVVLYFIGVVFAGFREVLRPMHIISSFFDGVYFVFSWNNNVFFLGLPCVAIGWYIYKNKVKVSTPIAAGLLCVSLLLKSSETLVNGHLYMCELSMFQILTGSSFFLLAYSLEFTLNENTTMRIRGISTTIFLTHSIFLFFIDDTQQKNGIVDFVIVVALCLLCDWMASNTNNRAVRFIFQRK